jgi:hypothetical protein
MYHGGSRRERLRDCHPHELARLDVKPTANDILLDRFGFAREAEASYEAFITRDPSQPKRVLVLAAFLIRQVRTTEAVAILEAEALGLRLEARDPLERDVITRLRRQIVADQSSASHRK